MRLDAAIAGALLLSAASVLADEVYLKSGGRIRGIVTDESPESVEVEIGAGRVAVARSKVARIVRAQSPLATYQSRVAGMARGDLQGWLDLASWASDAELSTQAREAYLHVLELQPDNAVARRALGEVLLGDRWMSEDEAMLARGFVRLDGRWITPQERDFILGEREAARREGLDLAKERASLAEAEARAREAEARARMAEVDAKRAEHDGGALLPPETVVVPGFIHVDHRDRRDRHRTHTSSSVNCYGSSPASAALCADQQERADRERAERQQQRDRDRERARERERDRRSAPPSSAAVKGVSGS
jgi:hypothetical protein